MAAISRAVFAGIHPAASIRFSPIGPHTNERYRGGMTITMHSVGRFKEVVFRDFEDADVCARSGLLDEDQARDLADRLHQVSHQLWQSEPADDNQQVLPFFGAYMGAGSDFPDDRRAVG
jgi:hypothetical protein